MLMASSVQSSSTCCNGMLIEFIESSARSLCCRSTSHKQNHNKNTLEISKKAHAERRAHLISLTYGFNFTVKSFLDTNHRRYVDVQQWKHLFLICRSISFFSQIISTILIVIIVQRHINRKRDVHSGLGFVFVEMFALKNQIIMIFFCLPYLLVVAKFGIKTKNGKEKKRNIDKSTWFDFVMRARFFSFFVAMSRDVVVFFFIGPFYWFKSSHKQ